VIAHRWQMLDHRRGLLKNPKGMVVQKLAAVKNLTTEEVTDFDFRFEGRIAPVATAGVIYLSKA